VDQAVVEQKRRRFPERQEIGARILFTTSEL